MTREDTNYILMRRIFWRLFNVISDKDEVKEPQKEKSHREKLLEKKRRLKEMFDSEYDDKGGDYFDNLKAEMSQQAQVRSCSGIQYYQTFHDIMGAVLYFIYKIFVALNELGVWPTPLGVQLFCLYNSYFILISLVLEPPHLKYKWIRMMVTIWNDLINSFSFLSFSCLVEPCWVWGTRWSTEGAVWGLPARPICTHGVFKLSLWICFKLWCQLPSDCGWPSG